MDQLFFENSTFLDISDEEQQQLKAVFLAAIGRKQPDASDSSRLAGHVRLAHLALRYGVDATSEGAACAITNVACFLRCAQEPRSRGRLWFRADDPRQVWHCDGPECGRQGELATACELMQSPGDESLDARRERAAAELTTMAVGLNAWHALAQHPITAKVLHNAAVSLIGWRRDGFELRCTLIEAARDRFLLRDLLRKPDLGYRHDREGRLGFPGYLFVCVRRYCRRQLGIEMKGRHDGPAATVFTDLGDTFDSANLPAAQPAAFYRAQAHELSVIVDDLDDDHREVGRRLLAGQSLRQIQEALAKRGRAVSYDWVFKRAREVKQLLRRAVMGGQGNES